MSWEDTSSFSSPFAWCSFEPLSSCCGCASSCADDVDDILFCCVLFRVFCSLDRNFADTQVIFRAILNNSSKNSLLLGGMLLCDGKKASSSSLRLRKKNVAEQTFDFQHQTDHSTGEQNTRQTKKFDTTDEIHERRKNYDIPTKAHTKFFLSSVLFHSEFPTRHTKHTHRVCQFIYLSATTLTIHWLCDTCISPTSRSLTQYFPLFLHSSFH